MKLLLLSVLHTWTGGGSVHPPKKSPTMSMLVVGDFFGGLQNPPCPCVSTGAGGMAAGDAFPTGTQKSVMAKQENNCTLRQCKEHKN